MKLFKEFILIISILFFSANAFSQNTVADSTQNNFMYENGKIYVVVTVAAIIVLGLFFLSYEFRQKNNQA